MPTVADVVDVTVTATMILLAVAGWAIYFHTDQSGVAEALKVVAPFIAGAVGGYWFGRLRSA